MIGDRLVRDARHLALHHLFRQLKLRCEMQVREQQLILAHPRIFRCDRLFDLDDHVAGFPNLVSRIEQLAAGFYILIVVKARAFTGRLLHKNFVTGVHQSVHTRRRQTDTILIVLDLFWQTNLHKNYLQKTVLL